MAMVKGSPGVIYGLAGVAVVACIVAAFVVLSPKGPRAAVDDGAHDFGDVDPNTTVSCSFRVGNVGRASLVFKRIRIDCACAEAFADRGEVLPGGSALVKVDYHTPGEAGAISSNVLAETNDPGARFLHFKVTGQIRAKPLAQTDRSN